jgi:hypothetical protein
MISGVRPCSLLDILFADTDALRTDFAEISLQAACSPVAV